MKQLTLAAIFCLLFDSYYSQGWRKKLYLPNSLNSHCRNVIETPTGNLIAIGVTQDTLNNKLFGKLTLVGLDSAGNYLWTKTYGRLNFMYFDAISTNIVREAVGFLLTICVKDSIIPQYGALLKFNYNGDTLWQKTFTETLPDDFLTLGLTASCDNGYLLTGLSQSTGINSRCFVVKTDKNGNELWRKKFNKSVPNISLTSSIVQDTLTKNIIITGYHNVGSSMSWKSQALIIIMDSLGNNPVRKSIDNNDGSGFGNLIQLKDKNFLVSGNWGVNNNWGTSMATLLKFDIAGKTLWLRVFSEVNEFNTAGESVELANGNIALVAFTDTARLLRRMEFLILNNKSGLISRKHIGSADLSTSTYTNGFKYPNSLEAMTSLKRTKDNGFILSSWFPYKQAPHPFSIIKLDSTGCDTTEQWCTSVALGNDKLEGLNDKFKVFPNPATDVLNLELNGYAENKLQIKITDVNGRALESLELEPNQSIQLNTSAYSPGLYFVVFSQNNSAVETRKLVIVR